MANDQGYQDFGDMGGFDGDQQEQAYQYEMDDDLELDENYDFSGYYDSTGTPGQVTNSTSMADGHIASNGNIGFSGSPFMPNDQFNSNSNFYLSGTPGQASTPGQFSSNDSLDLSGTPNQSSTPTPMASGHFATNTFNLSGTPNMFSTSTPMMNDQINSSNFIYSGNPNQASDSISMALPFGQVIHSSGYATHSNTPQHDSTQGYDINNGSQPSVAPALDLSQDTSSPISENDTVLSTESPSENYTYAPKPANFGLPTPHDSGINLHDMSDVHPEDLVPRSMPPAPPNTPSSPVATPSQPDPRPRFTSFETARYQVVENARIPAAIPNDDYVDVLRNIEDWVLSFLDTIKSVAEAGAVDNEISQKLASESGRIAVERKVWWLLEQIVRAHHYGVDPVISKVYDQPIGELPVESDMKCGERLGIVMKVLAKHYRFANCLVKGENMMPVILMPTFFLGLSNQEN